MKARNIASSLLSQDKQNQGFTLIELLVVIIIIGTLSAISLPSFLNQANKAKESEAKTYVGSGNRANQAYYLEKSHFTSDFNKLGLGIVTQTQNYQYNLIATDVGDDPASYEDVQVGTMWANPISLKNKLCIEITIEPDGTVHWEKIGESDTNPGLSIFIGLVVDQRKGEGPGACMYKGYKGISKNGILVEEFGGCRDFIEKILSKESGYFKLKEKK